MATLITAQIDCSKITKSKLKDGKYLDITIAVNDEVKEYKGYKTNVTITEAQTKDQRDSNEPKTYIGNGKVFWNKGEPVVVQKEVSIQTNTQGAEDETSDLPF